MSVHQSALSKDIPHTRGSGPGLALAPTQPLADPSYESDDPSLQGLAPDVEPQMHSLLLEHFFTVPQTHGLSVVQRQSLQEGLSPFKDPETEKYRFFNGQFMSELFEVPPEWVDDDYQNFSDALTLEQSGRVDVPPKELFRQTGEQMTELRRQERLEKLRDVRVHKSLLGRSSSFLEGWDGGGKKIPENSRRRLKERPELKHLGWSEDAITLEWLADRLDEDQATQSGETRQTVDALMKVMMGGIKSGYAELGVIIDDAELAAIANESVHAQRHANRYSHAGRLGDLLDPEGPYQQSLPVALAVRGSGTEATPRPGIFSETIRYGNVKELLDDNRRFGLSAETTLADLDAWVEMNQTAAKAMYAKELPEYYFDGLERMMRDVATAKTELRQQRMVEWVRENIDDEKDRKAVLALFRTHNGDPKLMGRFHDRVEGLVEIWQDKRYQVESPTQWVPLREDAGNELGKVRLWNRPDGKASVHIRYPSGGATQEGFVEVPQVMEADIDHARRFATAEVQRLEGLKADLERNRPTRVPSSIEPSAQKEQRDFTKQIKAAEVGLKKAKNRQGDLKANDRAMYLLTMERVDAEIKTKPWAAKLGVTNYAEDALRGLMTTGGHLRLAWNDITGDEKEAASTKEWVNQLMHKYPGSTGPRYRGGWERTASDIAEGFGANAPYFALAAAPGGGALGVAARGIAIGGAAFGSYGESLASTYQEVMTLKQEADQTRQRGDASGAEALLARARSLETSGRNLAVGKAFADGVTSLIPLQRMRMFSVAGGSGLRSFATTLGRHGTDNLIGSAVGMGYDAWAYDRDLNLSEMGHGALVSAVSGSPHLGVGGRGHGHTGRFADQDYSMLPRSPHAEDGADGGDMSLRFSAGHSAGQTMRNIARDDKRFRRGPASGSTDLAGIVADYALTRDEATVTEMQEMRGHAESVRVYEVTNKNGGKSLIHHDKDGSVWVDSTDQRAKTPEGEDQPVQGGDLAYQAAMTYAYNNDLVFKRDPRDVSSIAVFRRISHMLSSALRHKTTRHLMPEGVDEHGQAYHEVPGWQEGNSEAAYQHNVDLLARLELEHVKAAAAQRGIKLENLRWDAESDTVTDDSIGRRLSTGAVKEILSGLDSGGSGVGPTTLSRALVTRHALQLDESAGGGGKHTGPSQGDEGGGVSDRSGAPLFRLLEERELFYSQPTGRGGATLGTQFHAPGELAGIIADGTQYLNRALPGLVHKKTRIFKSTEELLNSDYARQRGYTDEQRAQIQSAEGFFDPQTKDTIIIAGNIVQRQGETPRQAFSRVTLHERVGHDGLDYLLGSNTRFATRWTSFLKQLQNEKRTELDAIAAEKDYQHLAGKDDQLALEWFARQVENNPALLESPGKIREAWQAMRELVIDLFPSIGLKLNKGRAFDDQVHDLMSRARRAALKGKNKPNQEGGSLIRSTADAESGTEPDTESPHPQPTFDTATVRTRLNEPPDTAKLQELGAVFVKMAARPDVFSLGLTPRQLDPEQNRTLADSLEVFGVPAKLKIEMAGTGVKGQKLPRYELDGGENLGSIKVRENAKGGIIIDTSKAKGSALSTRAYQAIYTWALHNGKVVIPDEQYLPDGIYRRVSHMHSSALRHGTTRHMEPHEEAKVLRKHWRYAKTPEEQAEVDMHNIGLLAWQEALLVLELQPNLGNYGYNPATDHLYAASPHGSGRVQGRTDATAEGIEGFLDRKGSEAAQRVGPATAARTLLLNDWLAQHDAGSGGRMVGTVSKQRAPLKFLYSLPGGSGGDKPGSKRQRK